jgi:hypothetical protein
MALVSLTMGRERRNGHGQEFVMDNIISGDM